LGTYLANTGSTPFTQDAAMDVIRAAHSGLKAMLCLTVLQGCAGSGKGLDADGNPIGAGSSGSVPLSADFASLQANVFTPICSVCHVGGGAPEGLRLDAADSYSLLVNVPSTEVPSLMRVKPGDPDHSYIVQKLEGTAAVGGQMPLGGPYLPASTIAFIRQWISNGAPPAAAAAASSDVAADGLILETMVPDASEPVTESPPQILLTFNHDLDVSQLAVLTAHIEGPAANIAAHLSAPAGNLKALMIVPEQSLEPGHYRVLLHSDTAPTVSDLSGHSLALGTPMAELPGASGDALLLSFDVEVLP
jgi:methionine-rich copper-binding protein CopC